MANLIQNAARQDEAEETTVGLIVAGGNTAIVLQRGNKTLDAGAWAKSIVVAVHVDQARAGTTLVRQA